MLNYDVDYFNFTSVLTVRYVGSYLQCTPAFENLSDFVLKNNIKTSRCMGLCYDDPDKIKNPRYDACFEIDKSYFESTLNALKDNNSVIRLDNLGGFNCLKTKHKGSYKGLHNIYSWLFSLNSYNFDFTKPSIEVYLNSPRDVSETELETEVYIPIIK